MPTVTLTLARFAPADRDDWLVAAARLLSAAEREQADAIPDPDTRARHAIGRALLRLAGAHASGRDPTDLRIRTTARGKPVLAELPHLGVSIAHTGRAVLVATCAGEQVGVDIESQPPASSARRVAERRFSAPEAAALRALPDEAAAAWFARAWTLKEAVGKALGVGLAPALAGAVVSDRADSLVSVWRGPPAHSWTTHQLSPPGGEEWIAVAIPAPGFELGALVHLALATFARNCPDAAPSVLRASAQPVSPDRVARERLRSADPDPI